MQSSLSGILLFSYIEKHKRYLVYGPLVVYWIILFISTSLPLESVPSVGLSDKFMHTVAYSGLGVLLYLSLSFQRKYLKLHEFPIRFTLIIGLIYAVVDELHQLLVPGRKCDIVDMVADGLGLVLGLLLIIIIRKIDTLNAGNLKT